MKNKLKNDCRVNLKLDTEIYEKLITLTRDTHRTITGVISLGIDLAWEAENEK